MRKREEPHTVNKRANPHYFLASNWIRQLIFRLLGQTEMESFTRNTGRESRLSVDKCNNWDRVRVRALGW